VGAWVADKEMYSYGNALMITQAVDFVKTTGKGGQEYWAKRKLQLPDNMGQTGFQVLLATHSATTSRALGRFMKGRATRLSCSKSTMRTTLFGVATNSQIGAEQAQA